ncbi:hypothetical protein SBADM41S_11288 [Streptomyces badius]
MQQTPQANGSGITLRPHQVEAVDRIVSGLSLPASGTMPVGGLRGQVHMATGTGKTVTAILQGLRAHDDRVIERMALPTTIARGQITSVLALDPQAPLGPPSTTTRTTSTTRSRTTSGKPRRPAPRMKATTNRVALKRTRRTRTTRTNEPWGHRARHDTAAEVLPPP